MSKWLICLGLDLATDSSDEDHLVIDKRGMSGGRYDGRKRGDRGALMSGSGNKLGKKRRRRTTSKDEGIFDDKMFATEMWFV